MEKGSKNLKAEAVPFILINEKQDGGKITYEFQLQRKAIDVFLSIKNKKIAVATVAGPQRSGKSFLSNRLLKRMTGFAIGPSTMPCTKGIWIWGEPIELTEDTVLVIMDTQGLNSVQRDINVDLKIFSLSILLSSVFVYNSLGHIDEKALENMSYVLKITQNIRMKSQSEGDAEISKCFPFFYWVLRDFSLDLKGMTENQYLESALKAISNDQKDPKNQIRSKIKKLFTHRKCQCFPRPINDEQKLAFIENLKYEDLRQKFRDKMKQFQKTFFETVPVKLINGKPLTADIYLNLVREYVDAMNNGKVPEVLNSLERVLQSEARQISQNLYNNYKQTMNKVANPDEPVDQIIIQRNHRDFVKKIAEKMDEKLKNWLQFGKTKEYKNNLLQSLEKDFTERKKKNANLSDKRCAAQFLKISALLQLPEIKSTEVVSDSFFRQKYSQLTKKISGFLEVCKAPRKYIYFIQKYPKLSFDFFDLFLARVKGVFNGQINKLKAENRGNQIQIQSSKRILKQQQNLLLEKQKQIQAVHYEKDVIRRQLDKFLKIKQFQQETTNMNKNELKKTLENYKTQIIELENANQELESQLQKFKNELSTKKIEISQIIKKGSTNETQETTHSDEHTPNELVSTLSLLKQKISAMKQFYDKKISDESLDESIIRQIQQLRTQKHLSIEKIKEQYRIKHEENRKKFNKARQEYEKNIKLMNQHMDDLKSQNIDLQRRIHELPGAESKFKNFNLERKNLQESLRLKQNNINNLMVLNNEKQKRLEDMESALAIMKAERANFESYKETFPFILRESLNWVQQKNNKLKHSLKTLTNEDILVIKGVFKELNLNPF